MKEEPIFYAIDAAIEVAENPKYEEIVVTPTFDLPRLFWSTSTPTLQNSELVAAFILTF